MDLQEFINNITGINIAMASVVAVALVWTIITHFNNRGRNFRSSRNKRARRQF